MGKIKKSPTERHTATASPVITQYVESAASVPLHKLPAKLDAFPRHWPFPRGDLYHWIPLLDRFDHIYEIFNREYGLNVGLQFEPFGRRILERGDAEEGKPQPNGGAEQKELDAAGYGVEGDRELVQSILRFTRVLLERCGNRSLYASSGQINDLLHTTSLDLLQACLKLSLRLAQRYQVARFKNNNPPAQGSLLFNHYNINLDNVHKISLPLPRPRITASSTNTSKSKEKSGGQTYNPADLVAMARNTYSATARRELSTLVVTYPAPAAKKEDGPTDTAPDSPTPHRQNTTPLNTASRSAPPERSRTASDLAETPARVRDSYFPAPTTSTYELSASEIAEKDIHHILKDALQHVPKDSQYDLLQRVRIAKVFASSESQIKQLLEIRLLAIANLAYALDNAKFQENIGNADAEEPRRFHLAHQLCDLLQPSSDGQSSISLTAETTVIDTLEALARCRHKSSEVIDALAVTVNHGVLYYELRRAIASLQSNTEPQDPEELIRIDWRIAIFDLITTISQVHNHIRCAEKMVSAGIMEILTEALRLRTNSAERVHDKILGFISSFTHGIQSAFPALANAHGLEAITDLASDQVTAALKYYNEAGPATHNELKSKVVDYSITYYQQSTLRSILKFICYLFDHTSGVHDRLTRNLLDSPQTLKSLREIIGNAPIFGSNVWDAAINTVSNFIHHEPTSFQVIAEAGLARGILEAVTQRQLEDEQQSDSTDRDEILLVDGKIQLPTVKGILPVSETICDIPTAFGAICLNEDGMNLFQTSGALDAYFDIFLSPNHVKALEEESQTAFSIGNQFDELSRHHPGLQSQILDAVIRMLKRVQSLCNLMAPQSSVTLRSTSSATTSEDTAMSNSTSESQEEIFNRAPAIPYISACFKFLEGFFHNSTMCQKFCRTGSADVVLDLIISPANPYDLSVFPVIGKMATVVHRLCEEKPHLVLPSLLARAVSNVEQMEAFAESKGAHSYFDAYTTIDHTSESIPDGIKLARSLANTCALSIVLGRIFTTPGFSGRNASTNPLFNNLNFTDVYVSLIAGLGKLHSACIWEDLALQQRIPDRWKPFVKPEVLHVRNVDPNGVVHITHNCAHCKFEGMEGKDELIADISGPENLKKLFAFKNSRLLLFLLKQVSSGVEQFFQSLGVVLLPKRTIDNYHKENANLVAEQLAQSLVDSFTYRKFENSTELDLARYHDSILNTTNKMLLRTTSNIESFGAKEAITIVLLKFHNAGGLDRMNELVEREISAGTTETSLKEARSDNLNLILSFFAQITRSKCILDAAQSLPITVRGYEYVDYFVPAQFLVEIRLKVLSSVSKLWKSDAMGNLSANNAKPVIEILQNILTGDGEERAIKRSDNAMKKIAAERPTFKLKFPSHLGDLLQSGIERSLAWESIHRCYNDQTRALEYCELRTDGSAPRFPLEETLLDKPIGRDGSVHVVERSTSQSNQAEDHEDSDDSMSDDDNNGSLGRLPSDVVNQDLADMGGELLQPWVQSEAQSQNGDRKVPFLTVDDLNEKRTNLKEDLIDRCLEVLSTTSTVTFALADLIQAAVAKTGESANPRAEIGKTLVSSLMSLQGDDHTLAIGTKISAYAHLVALILQDRDFFDSTFDELQDYFSSLIDWIMIDHDETAEEKPYVETILLIIERVLAEDEQPREIQWTPPPANQPFDKATQLAPIVAQPAVSEELRLKLFSVVKAILPKIGKNHSLALSISRVLVILTRDPTIAAKAKDKQLLQRLFLMVRQLARPVGERLQSAIMLILRHCVEDEDSIRQSMRTGIKTAFESGRHVRGMDLNGYVRTLHQMVLREPKIFAEVTAEMIEITNFNGNVNKSHQLALKKPQTPSNDDAEASKDANAQMTDKSAETKVSSESTDGIVQFLLRELSNFKEVDDSAAPSKSIIENEQTSNTDQSGQNGSAEPTSTDSQATDVKNARQVFKPEDNVIYIYRCFLMQCLAELLACYSRTKHEFINFSRKTEGPSSTPLKPRSGTINYLLNQLLPVGTLEHRDDSTHRKKVATSDWATTVLVALCSQTHEKPYYERRGAAESELSQEDSDLTFVRRFVLEHAIRSFKDALTSTEAPDMRYSRLMAFADLFDRMLNTKQDRSNVQTAIFARSQMQIGRLMYEKNCIAILTASIAELDLSLPNAKRVVKHILGPIKTLTDLAVTLSQQGEISSSGPGTSTDDEEISSATSVSDEASDEERENTPDLFRNSTLSMFESSGAHEEESDSPDDEDEDEDDDEEMFDAGFDEEMEYEDGNGDTISDDDEDVEGMEGMDEMGDIEGMPGDVEYDVEIINEDEEDDDEDDDEDESDDDDDEDDEDVDDDDIDDEHDEYLQSMEEITGAEDNVSNPEMDEGAWEENAEYGHIMPDEEGNSPPGGPLEHIAEVLGADDHEELERHGIVGIDLANGPPDFFDEDMMGGHEDDEDEEYDGEVAYEPEVEEDEETAERWGIDLDTRAHNAFFHPRGPERAISDVLNRLNDIRRPEVRLHRGGHGHQHHQQASDEGGLHPLLQRMDPRFHGHDQDQPVGGMPIIMSEHGLMSGARSHAFQDFMMALDRNEFSRFTVTMGANGMPASPFHGMRHFTRFMDMNERYNRDPLALPFYPTTTRQRSGEEAQAVDFKPAFTSTRWEEEGRILFSIKAQEKATRIINTLQSLLLPPAMEAKRLKDIEEAERKAAAEAKAKEEQERAEAEKAELEKKQREEREALEAEEAARALAELNSEDQTEVDTDMAGTEPVTTQAPETAVQEPAAPRITANIRGRTVDITNLGIDHEYLQALPEEFREEVIMSQFAEQRSQAHQAGETPNEISREFLEALPPEIQAELMRQETIDRRRRERDLARQRQAAEQPAQPPAQAQDMEAMDFLATLDPITRQQILMDVRDDPNYMSELPEDIQREARALMGDRRNGGHRLMAGDHPRIINIGREQPREVPTERNRSRPIVQMLDKAGVATLLRLMFVSLHYKPKTSLHNILSQVCKNTQNRAEVISILLSILQDGTADVSAVERSFAQLTLRAKQNGPPKTPQPLKRTLTGQIIQPVTELSPLTIVQHCLGTLTALATDNPKVQTFFLSEHETVTSQKSKSTKKSKSKESKAAKYPLNALLTLLDRKLITENTGVMETLASLLSRVTLPLQILLKRAKEAQDAQEKAGEAVGNAEQSTDAMETSTADVRMQETSGEVTTNETADEQAEEQSEKKKRSTRELEPPDVPEDNIRLVVNILAARECPSKTFSDTLDIIKHMAAIPGAREVFGRELIRQAQELGSSVVTDLNDLAEHIGSATSGTDIQGMALASFSSSGSKQRKLLRILVALDHLFDPKRIQALPKSALAADAKLKEEILATLYESETFQGLWKTLSLCLTAIRQRGDMVNVATILLPLIESLMVVCRNSALKDAPLNASQAEVRASTPPPETRMEDLFFKFTEEHRKILNELIRNNPKLMNGNLSILAKNSKVLEFDNKRNYFNRKVHNKGAEGRVAHPALTLNVRRDQVFLDSYKMLYYKSGDEIKTGKLNIRFTGEEGVDAGGVSREWFAVMARQMFNPDFALFNPVASDRTTFHPNSLSDINPEHLSFFKFIGRVIGKALYEGRVLDCHFSRAVYRRILGKSVSLKDMETLDLDYYKSLVWILENDITDITFETFSVEVDKFGVVEVVDLIENGRNIAVTEENKQEYVRLVVEHRLVKSVEEQLDNFLKGFHDIIPSELISIFNEQELELLISGLPDIDVDDWKNNTEYHNYQATSAQIQWFWRAVKSFDPEERAKLLQFVTGTSKVPLNGFKELEGMNGFAKFNIHRDYSSKEKLPTSHTCFNQLDLPEYESYEHLRQQLYTAITAGSEYFGFA